MKHHVVVGEAFRQKGFVEWIPTALATVDGEKYNFLLERVHVEPHIFIQPALQPSLLIIIAPALALRVIIPMLETVHEKIPHVRTDGIQRFHQFTVRHEASLEIAV